MNLRYEIDASSQTARLTGKGTVDMMSALRQIEAVADDPRFHPHFRVLFDLRGCTYTAELEDGDRLANLLGKRKQDFQNKFVIVVPEAFFLLVKLYCLLANMAGMKQVVAFTDMRKAEEYFDAP